MVGPYRGPSQSKLARPYSGPAGDKTIVALVSHGCLERRTPPKTNPEVWFRPRELLPTYRDIDSIPRVAPGTEPRQRPLDQEVKPLTEKIEDACYHRSHMARVTAELVRPDVSGNKWGGYDLDQMRVAFLARAVQTRLPYIHFCTTAP